jgi:hypothetical protein
MPLASGVVSGAAAAPTLLALEKAMRDKGHVDTGLTGTYFMCATCVVCACVNCGFDLILATQDKASYGASGVHRALDACDA